MENSIEEDIKIALDKFSDNKDIDSAILIVEKFILGNYILRGGRTNIAKDSLRYILSNYKRVLEENEELRAKWDKDTHILQNELDLTNADKINNYIPVQKIKDKIKELNKLLTDIDYKDIEDKQEREFYKKEYYQVVAQIKVLKELLKEEE